MFIILYNIFYKHSLNTEYVFYNFVQGRDNMVSCNDILDYINFLIRNQKLYISLHGEIIYFPKFTKYCIHAHPFCVHIKNTCDMAETCRAQQKKVLKRCQGSPFFGVCHAGMGEFVYPLKDESTVFGFISVSGYLSDTEKGLREQNSFMKKTKNTFYPIPDKAQIDTLLRPLVIMCESYYSMHKAELINNTLISKILQYINKNYTYNITMEKLSEKFNYSVSAISHQFKKETGVSLNKYIENLRMKSAKSLMLETDLQLTEIALSLGFCNVAYFSTLFKRHMGITPSEYRRKIKND